MDLFGKLKAFMLFAPQLRFAGPYTKYSVFLLLASNSPPSIINPLGDFLTPF